ncbi:MAG: hypothetical protein UHD09_04650 [Bifidobacterium sp.]|nr:hypothetical protein [Bifidobacterium sp.]
MADEHTDDLDAFDDAFDEELRRAMADFERQVRDEDANKDAAKEKADAASQDPLGGSDGVPGELESELRKDISEFEHSMTFDDELQGLLGNKAKCAMVCTRLEDADLLAAFCALADISAQCVQASEGVVAVLRNLEGNGPEAAAEDLTTVVSGLSVLLVVNRADKVEATVYTGGKKGETLPPPFVFPTLAPFVEDMMLGMASMDTLTEEGLRIVDSATLDHRKALSVIAAHTRFNGPEGRID